PFTTVDTALKLFRMFLLSLVVVTHFVNAYLGGVFSLFLIVISYFLAGWSFRLLVMGWVFAWDFFTNRSNRFAPELNGNWMFTAGGLTGAPLRTYGRLFRAEDGQLVFEYGPWILMRKRRVPVPSGHYGVGRGLFYPEMMRLD